MLTSGVTLLLLLLLGLAMATKSSPSFSSFSSGDAKFASKLYNQLAKSQSSGNLIVSPASIRTGLALTYLGANGSTEDELKQGLELQAAISKTEVAQQFAELLSKEGEMKLKYANRIYVAQKFELAPAYQDLVSKNFNASAVNVNFSQGAETAQHINAWVEQQTQQQIKNLIAPDSLNADTAAILINAIYFKADWFNSFAEYSTAPRDFTVRGGQKVKVDTMHQSDYFQYGELAELKAKALELPYEGTDIVFLIILPQEEQGLEQLEEQLNGRDLNEISGQLSRRKVEVELPKFKYEYEISLQPALEELGLRSMFGSQANFGSLLKASAPLHISEVKHKAFIEVNEKGTTATGATFIKAQLESYLEGEVTYQFTVNRPFFFAIKDKQSTYFLGHVNSLPPTFPISN